VVGYLLLQLTHSWLTLLLLLGCRTHLLHSLCLPYSLHWNPCLQIRCAMVTGDHLRTAISVAHQCSILPPARPVLLLDAAPPGQGIAAGAVAGVPPSAPGVKLSVLYPDGSVNESVPRSMVIPQVGAGDRWEKL
jgi:hypothetical protein